MSLHQHESSYRMVPLDEAHQIVAAHITALPAETVSSLTAVGRVLAEDVFATENVPDIIKSLVDGYAVRTADGMCERQVVAEVTAGSTFDAPLLPGTAVRIMTGAPVPPGADAVVMFEDTEEQSGQLRVHTPIAPGAHMQTVGQDIAQGQQILARGTTLGPPEIGLLAALGQTQVNVYRRPRVAILATGDEVVEPDAPRMVGQVRDSNRYALLAAVHEAGAEGLSLGIARDDVQVQRDAILQAIVQADMLITSGGISLGTRDLIKPLVAELGIIHFGRVAFKPGKPRFLQLSIDQRRHRFWCLVCRVFQFRRWSSLRCLCARPCAGYRVTRPPERPRVRVTLLEPIRTTSDRPEYQRTQIAWHAGQLVARSTGLQSSTRLLSLRGANGLLVLAPGIHEYPIGTEVEALLTGPLLVDHDRIL